MKLKPRLISIKSLLLSHFIFAIIICTLFGFFSNLNAAKSALWGALTWVFPSLFFAAILLRKTIRTPNQLFIIFYIGELLKLFFSALLIALALKFLSPAILPFLAGYIGAILSFWVAILIEINR
ncbi:MAG: ATP synthase subunit I [Gammaproteobacteria bacterium]|nr:ATP synthase subunit I [Gammaproteobacteria bacterium]